MKVGYIQTHTPESVNEGHRDLSSFLGYPNLHSLILKECGHSCELITLHNGQSIKTDQNPYGDKIVKFPKLVGSDFGKEISGRLWAYLIKSDFDILHIRGYKQYNIFPVLPLISLCKPTLVHHLGPGESYSDISIGKRIRNFCLSSADCIASLDDSEIEGLRTTDIPEIPERKIRHLPNAVNTNIFNEIPKEYAADELGFPSDNRYILYVGRIISLKNVVELVDAFAKVEKEFSDIKLLIVGTGPQSEVQRVRKTIKANELSSDVLLKGSVGHKQLPYYYNLSDIFISPSEVEGLSNTILEASCCKAPFIGTSAHGSDRFINEENCLLVNPSSNDFTQDLSSAMSTLLSDHEMRDVFADRAYTVVSSNFGIKAVADDVEDAYLHTIEEHNRSFSSIAEIVSV